MVTEIDELTEIYASHTHIVQLYKPYNLFLILVETKNAFRSIGQNI